MSFFSFRRNRAAQPSAPAASAESVEVVRKRARQRLIGASVLVALAVVGFPLLFDSQPRPVPVDIAIEIPSRSAVKPGTPIGPTAATAAVGASTSASAAAPPAPVEPPPAAASGAEKPAEKTAEKTAEKAVEKTVDKPADKAPPKSDKAAGPAAAQSAVPATASLQDKEEIVSKPSTGSSAAKTLPAAPPAAGEAQRAQNLLEGKAGDASSSKRAVVQVGAYADAAKVREVRQKLEKAGLSTYTQVVETKEGQRTRVRVGPFLTREEAEKAVAKIKALDLPASVFTL